MEQGQAPLAPPADSAERSAAGQGRQVKPRHRELSLRARDVHDALTVAIGRLEAALASPAPGRAERWAEQVAADLAVVRKAIDAHIDDVEAPDGLFDEIPIEKPRLATRVERLRDEHIALAATASIVGRKVMSRGGQDFARIRKELGALLARLRSHRSTEADLVYEAFWDDLGAGD